MDYKIKEKTLASIASAIKEYYPSSSISVEAFPQAIREGAEKYAKEKEGPLIEGTFVDESGCYEIPSNISVIRDYCFYSCQDLKEIKGGKDIKIIKNNAFAFCNSLTSIPSFSKCLEISDNAFIGTNFSIADFPSVSVIRGYAFYNDSNLKTINFPCVNSIGNYAFMGTNISEARFSMCHTIGQRAFSGCINLEKASINNCIYIKSGAFERCTNLSQIYFPIVQSIEERAFSNCYNLSSALNNFPQCSYIGSFAFYNCSGIKEINLPYVSSIGASAFYGCWYLNSITLDRCKYIEDYAFPWCKIGHLSLPSCISIGANAFNGAGSLSAFYASQCQSIGNDAFVNCTKLAYVSIPNIQYIGSSAFCYNMNTSQQTFYSLNIPKCNYIGSYAFYFNSAILAISVKEQNVFQNISVFGYCSKFTSIYLNSTTIIPLLQTPTNIFYSTPFTGVAASSPVRIYVPMSLVDSYKTATNWSVLSSFITGYNFTD